MSSKLVSIKQIKEFFVFEEKMNNTIHQLLNFYLYKKDSKYIEACKNFEEFRFSVIKDLSYYLQNDNNRNYDDFKASILILEEHVNNFKKSYDLK